MPAVLILWLLCMMFNVGFLLPFCGTSVSVHDLACRLNWKCSDINSSTTFTVQAKAQGESWQNVSHCIQISSTTCDLSQVFKSLRLYNFVRLVLNHEHGTSQKMESTLCDPTKDKNATFSAPSVSVSLEDSTIWVKVSFPCVPSEDCVEFYEWNEEEQESGWNEEEQESGWNEEEQESDEEKALPCCTLTIFRMMNTTVILYNKQDVADTQTYIEPMPGEVLKLQFGALTPGQEYCAVARLTSSSFSEPQCVRTPLQGKKFFSYKSQRLLLVALCVMIITLLLIVACVVWRQWALIDTRLPKPLLSLEDREASMVEEPMQAASEDEGSIVNLSIISLPGMGRYSDTSLAQSIKGEYYTTAFLQNQDTEREETQSHSGEMETDGGPDPDPTSYPWPRWSSLPVLRPGMVCLLGVSLPVVDSMIPLSSVRVAVAQIDEVGVELDFSAKGLTNLNNDGESYSNIC